jgi:preprotein translocase subunit SecA
MGGFKLAPDEPIASGMISKTLETAQKRIEGFNFDSRKQVLAYDDVLNSQRLSIYLVRRTILLGSPDEVKKLVDSYIDSDSEAEARLTEKLETMPPEVADALLRRILLQIIDMYWLEQLETMDYLRRSVSLRAYGQRDPLIEYRKEGLQRFRDMEANIARAFVEAIPRIQVSDDTELKKREEKVRTSLVAASGADEQKEEQKKEPVVRENMPGRNELVTLTRGEETVTVKYKKAEDYLNDGWSLSERAN